MPLISIHILTKFAYILCFPSLASAVMVPQVLIWSPFPLVSNYRCRFKFQYLLISWLCRMISLTCSAQVVFLHVSANPVDYLELCVWKTCEAFVSETPADDNGRFLPYPSADRGPFRHLAGMRMPPSVELQIGKRSTKNSQKDLMTEHGLPHHHGGWFSSGEWLTSHRILLFRVLGIWWSPVLLNWTHYDTLRNHFFLVICYVY